MVNRGTPVLCSWKVGTLIFSALTLLILIHLKASGYDAGEKLTQAITVVKNTDLLNRKHDSTTPQTDNDHVNRLFPDVRTRGVSETPLTHNSRADRLYPDAEDNHPITDSKNMDVISEQLDFETPLSQYSHIDRLDPDAVRNQVMYFWCGASASFQFQNYMSMKSVIRVLQPDNIYFLYDVYPTQGKKEYYMWFDDLQQEYPFIRLEKIESCPESYEERMTVIMDDMKLRGGFYVHENTTITSSVAGLRKREMVNALDPNTGQGFLMTRVGMDLRTASSDIQCATNSSELTPNGLYCVNADEEIFPAEIWEYNGTFRQLARWAAYGKTGPMRAVQDYSELAPNIAHYTWPLWPKHTDMDFTFYISILSVLYVGKVDVVYIHGEAPTGPYWERLQPSDKIKVVYRNTSTSVYMQTVKGKAHISDIWRLDALLKYGGLYMDMDAILVKPIDIHQRAYQAYGSFVWQTIFRARRITIQNGVMLGKPGATFWKEYQKSQKVFNDSRWLWNSCEVPYWVMERFPDSIHIDPYFNLVCYRGVCHPPDTEGLKPKTSSPDWMVANVYHFTGPIPIELTEEDVWKETKSIFSEIVEFILRKAKLL